MKGVNDMKVFKILALPFELILMLINTGFGEFTFLNEDGSIFK